MQPFFSAIGRHSANTSSDGFKLSGPQAIKFTPILALIAINELATLLCVSPTNAKVNPFSLPKCSSKVIKSASACVGCHSVVRPFHTGTSAYLAKSFTMSCPNPRYSIPSYNRANTRAVSAIDSLCPICEPVGSR